MNPDLKPGARHELRLPGGVAMGFRWIPPGEFRMGSRGNQQWEEPVHRVRIERGYWLGETPVTQRQYGVWKPEHENGFPGRPEHPVEQVDWLESVRFCGWLTATGESGAVVFPEGKVRACLPTEAEWEWACGTGRETAFWNGDGLQALRASGWFNENSGNETHAVKMKLGNRWGLYDLHGNVLEWCHDVWREHWYRALLDGELDSCVGQRTEEYSKGTAPIWEHDCNRVFRGGSHSDPADFCRSAFRFGYSADGRFKNLGFRVCLVAGRQAQTAV